MKKRIYIMMVGIPGSGKSTTANALKSVFNVAGLKTKILNKDAIRAQIAGAIGDQSKNKEVYNKYIYQLNQWIAGEAEYDVVIDDNTNINAFKRAGILKKIVDKSDDILICTINMNRDMKFCGLHNEDKDRVAVPKKVMKGFERLYQQPIYDEGFDVVFHVDKNKYIDCHKFMEVANKHMNDEKEKKHA